LREHLRAAGGRLDVLSQRMGLALSQLQVHYRDSPVVGEDRDPAAAARLLCGAAAEDAAWLDLGHGPAPGERVPEVGLPAAAGGPRRLKDLLDPLGHTLLLFEGLSRAGAAGEAIERVRSEVGRRFPRFVRVVRVLAEGGPSAGGAGAYLDGDGVLHRAFGAGRACLYLLRPDGYVGYRSQPPDWGRLLGHLRRLFTWKAVGGDRPPA
jgi:hypothetical protein